MTADQIDRIQKANPKVYFGLIFKKIFDQRNGFFKFICAFFTGRHLRTSQRLSSSHGYNFRKCCAAIWSDSARARLCSCESLNSIKVYRQGKNKSMRCVVVISSIFVNRLNLIGVLQLHLHLVNSKMKLSLFIPR